VSDEVETREKTALEVLDELVALEAGESERAQRELVEGLEEEHRRRLERFRRDVMATWDESKVRQLVEDGKLTAADVALWREERRALERRRALALGVVVW
jgi:hypothetical protein